ncbi:XRE family transcriptional regulator [Streptomyces flavofungini]|uniref:XRE family transcriptional regulator n=1 Tax=Streptomyces flavofungini TaxID=68200 RepID=UPI0025B123A2|nr:XRE family transcriptional regulator [Streptomyces flavofungini]WJV49888.1 XRE family transcriptional regulator [Streptomyces flavofungini]
MSQADLARELSAARGWPPRGPGSLCKSQVARWENRAVEPKDWRPYLEQVLDLNGSGYCDLTPRSAGTTAVDEGVDPVDRRVFLGATTVLGLSIAAPAAAVNGQRLGMADVERYSKRLVELRRLDDYSGGSSVYPLVAEEVTDLSRAANHGTYSDAVARSLLSILAELYQFASWVAFDSGRIERSKRLAQAASAAANQAGNRTLASTALSELSYITASSGKPKESVSMAQASLANAPKEVLPAVEVVLADRLAWAFARTGDARGVDYALGLSNRAHDRREIKRVAEPDTVYWINRDESKIMAGRCWAELRRPERSLPVLESLTVPYDDSHAREVSLYQRWLAGSYMDSGDLDRAVHAADRALELSRGTSSKRLNSMLDGMLMDFEPHKKEQKVRQLLGTWAM